MYQYLELELRAHVTVTVYIGQMLKIYAHLKLKSCPGTLSIILAVGVQYGVRYSTVLYVSLRFKEVEERSKKMPTKLNCGKLLYD